MNFYRITGLILLALLIGGCDDSKAKAQSSIIQPKKKPAVKAIVLKPQPIASKIKVAGTLDSRMRTWINAPSEGTILALDIREGNPVSPGLVIGYVMSGDQQNLLALAQTEYDQARSSADGDSSSKVKALKLRLDAAKTLYKPVPIVCPIKGVVITKSVEPGAIVSARQQLAEIADIEQLIIKSAISEQFASTVKPNQKVRVFVSGYDSAIVGNVSLIYPSVDIRSRTIGIEITIGSRKNLRPGMSAVIEFIVASKQAALALPHDAVLVRPSGEKIVFTVSDSTAHAHTVSTGIETNTMVEITEGLAAGEKVIIMGQDNIRDGAVVKVMDTPAQGGKGGQKK